MWRRARALCDARVCTWSTWFMLMVLVCGVGLICMGCVGLELAADG